MLKATIQCGLPYTFKDICLSILENGDTMRGSLKANSFSLEEEGDEPGGVKNSLIWSIGN